MHRAVILLHTLPDGASHFDWLIDRPDLAIEHRLISFRCAIRVDSSDSSSFCAQRLPDHRAWYLTYEGAVSGDRGVVEQVGSGAVLELEVAEESLFIVIDWGDCRVVYRGRSDDTGGGMWHFVSSLTDSALDG